ncbi:hypothetical protein NQ317_005129 [Molorchus minor]|uniref:UDP-glucuronosyltransferase n=1 Tax=Molorchus minor TaxID=1323400 RepID=A0ABQ9JPS1_9CUCU|nr:hypothetical protein NQ317_005129 [Molorchus minor]
MRFIVVLFALVLTVTIVKCSRILVVFPMSAQSHFILGSSLAKALAEAGHDVTYVSLFEEKNPPKNGKYTEVVLTGTMGVAGNSKMNFFDFEKMNPFLNIPVMGMICNTNLLKSGQHFDAVIIEQFNNDALKALAYHYNAPLILFSTIGANPWINNLVGNPSPPSYIPDIFLSYTSNMTFWQRLVNFLYSILSELYKQFIFLPEQNRLMKEVFPDVPDLSTLYYNVSLILVNSHESTNQPVPHVPNMIDIGGFHVHPGKELPKDLKDFMDNATEGVVYFSMGSNIKPSQMVEEKRNAILRSFGKLKQKVLWKWDEDNLPGKPNNVIISKWFPQQDILAHRNTKLFVTHGGLLSTTETVYHGVPILALPIFGDQKMNAARAQMNGIGISLSYSDLTEENFAETLDLLLNDQTYSENAKRRSKLMKDRPVKPKDLAVYWTEYIIRHNGAPHLRTYHGIMSISTVFVVIIYILIRRTFCNKKTRSHKVKKS